MKFKVPYLKFTKNFFSFLSSALIFYYCVINIILKFQNHYFLMDLANCGQEFNPSRV